MNGAGGRFEPVSEFRDGLGLPAIGSRRKSICTERHCSAAVRFFEQGHKATRGEIVSQEEGIGERHTLSMPCGFDC